MDFVTVSKSIKRGVGGGRERKERGEGGRKEGEGRDGESELRVE